jgi:hypothetical protein
LTLVIERTLDPTTWLVVTGWSATAGERELLADWTMSKDPWTDPDPQPGDFDADLADLDPRLVESHAGNPDAKLRMLIGVEGEDVARLERIAQARGMKPGDVVAELLRDADRSAAQVPGRESSWCWPARTASQASRA